jgi:hypothetical protein
MSDAVRNVTIRMNLVTGSIELPDLAPWQAARAAVDGVNASMKSLAETQRELAATEQTLGQTVRQTVAAEDAKTQMHQKAQESAKASADAQVAQSSRVAEAMINNLKESHEAAVATSDKEIEALKKQLSIKEQMLEDWRQSDLKRQQEYQAEADSVRGSSVATQPATQPVAQETPAVAEQMPVANTQARDADNAAINRTNASMKALAETQSELIKTEKTLGETVRQTVAAEDAKTEMHRKSQESAKASADAQIIESNRVKDAAGAQPVATEMRAGTIPEAAKDTKARDGENAAIDSTNASTKALIETQRELIKTEQTLGQTVRQTVAAEDAKTQMHKQAQESAKASADAQVAEANRIKESAVAQPVATEIKAEIVPAVKADTQAPDAENAAIDRTNASMKALAETQSELIKTEKTLGESVKDTVAAEDAKVQMHKTEEAAAKQSADVQVAESNRVKDTVVNNMRTVEEMQSRRPLREPGQPTSTARTDDAPGVRPLREPGEVGPSTQQRIIKPQIDTSTGNLGGLAEFSAKVEAEITARIDQAEKKRTEIRQKELAQREKMIMQEQEALIKAEEQMAANIIRTRESLNKQRIREHEENQARIDRENQMSEKQAQDQINDENAAFEAMESARNKEEEAVKTRTQKEIAEDEKAQQKKAASELKFFQDMRNQRMKEEEEQEAARQREMMLAEKERDDSAAEEERAYAERDTMLKAEEEKISARTEKEIAENEKAMQQKAAAELKTRESLNKQRIREHEDEQARIDREFQMSEKQAQDQIDDENAAFEAMEAARQKEEEAVQAQTQKEIAENEKALQQKAENELKFFQNMRNQRIKEEEAEKAAADKKAAEDEKAQQKQAAAELKFFQDMRNQRIREEAAEAKAAEEQAKAVLDFRARMNQQRLREEEQTARAVEQAQARLPALLRGVQQDMTQVIGATAQFAANLSMLDSIGGESLENIAKKFAKIQSTVGLITASNSIFSNVGEGLGKLTQMGAATRTIVQQQQALGVATTFSQAATLRLAGATGVLQAALGPIGLIFTGITAAIVVAEIAMDVFGESSEEAAEKQREQEQAVERFNRQLQESIRLLEQEKSILDTQTQIMENQWDIKKALAGDKGLSAGDMQKEFVQQTEQQNSMLNKEVNIASKNLEQSVSQSNQEEAKKLLDTEQQLITGIDRLKNKLKDADAAGVDSGGIDAELADKQKRLDQNAIEQEAMRQKVGIEGDISEILHTSPEQVQSLRNTEIKDGMIVDFAGMEQKLQTLPDELALSFLQDIQKPMQAQLSDSGKSLGEAQRALADAESKKKKSEQGILEEEKRFGAEEDMASKFGMMEGGFAKQEAMAALDRFDKSKTPEEKAMAADEAERALREQGLLSAEADAMLRGANTDTTAVRRQITDDAEITNEERTANDKAVADLTDLGKEANSAILVLPRLIEDLKAKLRAINEQNTALGNAIRNRDGI